MIETIRFAILVVSDRSARGERVDASGPAIAALVADQGGVVVRQAIVPDEVALIQTHLSSWADSGTVDVILTSGGTGFSLRDVTPEATQGILERHAPGIAEALRAASLQITPHAMLSRAVAGIRKRCLIVNLPGSPRGAVENLEILLPILPHAVQLLRDDPCAEAGHNHQAS